MFKVKKKNGFLFNCTKWLVHLIRGGKPTIINLNEDGKIPEGSIIIANHNGASGPMSYKTFLAPPAMMTWGAHQMCENYKSRRRYLIDVFYGQKLGFGKKRAWISGTLFAIVSGAFYSMAGIIPVYYDNRLRRTYEYSFECLKENVNVMIFPENSDNGYKEILEDDFHPGYLHFAKLWSKKIKKEVPIYTYFYSKKEHTIVIGKPHYISEIEAQYGKDGVNTFFREYMNKIGYDYILSKRKKTSEE